jgi:hypothetical protein
MGGRQRYFPRSGIDWQAEAGFDFPELNGISNPEFHETLSRVIGQSGAAHIGADFAEAGATFQRTRGSGSRVGHGDSVVRA